ncbi:MAG: zinc dependent phospholipase C family protein [Desulfotomaculum sp.]|nr:zinc dependent phospholipase C family protein [Desulfotomaculum sp.]
MYSLTWQAAKIILHAAAPIQKIIDNIHGDTHVFLNRQAVEILKNDGHHKISKYLANYIDSIDRGTLWADKGWKNFAHYYNPYTGRGIWPWPNAKIEGRIYFEKSIKLWKKGCLDKCLFYLGTAVHLIQDMCVPHHSHGAALSGHSRYERWVQSNYINYAVNCGGIYKLRRIEDWIDANARLSWDYYPYVTPNGTEKSYHQATAVLLTRAQQSTAGFFLSFMDTVI